MDNVFSFLFVSYSNFNKRVLFIFIFYFYLSQFSGRGSYKANETIGIGIELFRTLKDSYILKIIIMI